MGCREQASVWGFNFKTTAQHAAYLNAISMHVLDFEPMSNPPTHAVSPTVPAAFALGEMLKAEGALGEAIDRLAGRLAGVTSAKKRKMDFMMDPGPVFAGA
jgi:aconitate decarboxylase